MHNAIRYVKIVPIIIFIIKIVNYCKGREIGNSKWSMSLKAEPKARTSLIRDR